MINTTHDRLCLELEFTILISEAKPFVLEKVLREADVVIRVRLAGNEETVIGSKLNHDVSDRLS